MEHFAYRDFDAPEHFGAARSWLGDDDEFIARSRAKRRTAQQVQAAWASALELWEQADDDQKQTILRGLVQRVEMRKRR